MRVNGTGGRPPVPFGVLVDRWAPEGPSATLHGEPRVLAVARSGEELTLPAPFDLASTPPGSRPGDPHPSRVAITTRTGTEMIVDRRTESRARVSPTR